jgi:hypothetical protein
LALLLAAPALAQTGRDTTIYTATRVITAATGKITSVSVNKIALPASRVDTVKIPGSVVVRADTVHSYWQLTLVGGRGIYGLATSVGPKPANFTLPAARVDTVLRVDTVRLAGPASAHDTLVWAPNISVARDSVRWTLVSPGVWRPPPAYPLTLTDRYFYWMPVVGADSIRWRVENGPRGASTPPALPLPTRPGP